jgi:hypothetical protein
MAGWLRRTDGNGGDASHWSEAPVWSWASVEQASAPLSRVPPSFFEGAERRLYESGRHSVTELALALPHSAVCGKDGLTGRVGRTTLGYDSQACQRDGTTWIRL